MFRTKLLSIIRSLNTVYTAIGMCYASYVDCLLARSGWNSECQRIVYSLNVHVTRSYLNVGGL
jgi:hypothetical protein